MVMAVQRMFSNARRVAGELISGGSKRRKMRAFGLNAEPCEMRCLPAPLGAVPQMANVQVNSNSLTGMVTDDSGMNVYTVEMDIYNDGIVDQIVTTQWNPILNGSSWQWIIPAGMVGNADVQVGLTPRESNGTASHTGSKVVAVIPVSQTPRPRL